MNTVTILRIFATVLIAFSSLAFGFVCGASSMKDKMQIEAYRVGAGDWVTDRDGEIQWEWTRREQ